MFLRKIVKRDVVKGAAEFHSSSELCKQKYADREANMLKKLMTGSKHTKRKFFSVESTPSKQFKELSFLDSSGTAGRKKLSGKVQKRVKVLNVLFVEQVTSLLSTGEVGADLISEGFEITQVKVVPDFSHVLIYWQPSGTERDDVLESKLSRVAGHLRHELSQLRVIGIVPPIKFVKDPYQAKVSEVEKLLAKCDFGPDYVPLGLERLKNSPFEVTDSKWSSSSSSGSSVQAGIPSKPEFSKPDDHDVAVEEATENISEHDKEILNESLEEILDGPAMRQDIFGLDRAAIMKKITNAVQGSKPKDSSSTAPADFGGFAIPSTEDPDRAKEFIKYLEKQRRAKAREQKRNSAAAKEREFMRLQRLESLKSQQDSFVLDERSPFDGEDYLDEEELTSSQLHPRI